MFRFIVWIIVAIAFILIGIIYIYYFIQDFIQLFKKYEKKKETENRDAIPNNDKNDKNIKSDGCCSVFQNQINMCVKCKDSTCKGIDKFKKKCIEFIICDKIVKVWKIIDKYWHKSRKFYRKHFGEDTAFWFVLLVLREIIEILFQT